MNYLSPRLQRARGNMASEHNLISLDEARQKCGEKRSSFTRLESVQHILLSPKYLGRLNPGIAAQIDKQLMAFSHELQAIPVAYEKLQLVQRHGIIVETSPFIHVDVKVFFIVFKPMVGDVLIGTVNRLESDSIGCLVHGCFNASIRKGDNSSFFRHVDLGNELEFRVLGFEAVKGVLCVFGSIDEECHRRNRYTQIQLLYVHVCRLHHLLLAALYHHSLSALPHPPPPYAHSGLQSSAQVLFVADKHRGGGRFPLGR